MARAVKIELLSSAAAEDASVVASLTDLINAVYAVAEDGLWTDGTTRTTAGEVAGFIQAGEIAVAVQGEHLCGCVRVRRLDFEVSEFGMLAVAPSHRSTGIGRELVRFAEHISRDAGRGTMQLELLVPRDWKHPSKEFLAGWYARLGYETVRTGSTEEFYPDLSPLLATPCDFIVYCKDLRHGEVCR